MCILNFFFIGRLNSVSRGTPNEIMLLNRQVLSIPHQCIPSPVDAVRMYRNAGGRIREEHCFGVYPLSDLPDRYALRQTAFLEQFQFTTLFHEIVHGDGSNFKDGILFFVDITYRLSVVHSHD